MKALFKFSCYDGVDKQTRTTYRVVQGNDNLGGEHFWIEQKSSSGKGWYKTYKPFVHWRTLKELWNSPEFKSLFCIQHSLSNREK